MCSTIKAASALLCADHVNHFQRVLPTIFASPKLIPWDHYILYVSQLLLNYALHNVQLLWLEADPRTYILKPTF